MALELRRVARYPKPMDGYVDSTDRRPADFVLFAFGFFGFLLMGAGVIVASWPATLAGLLIKLFSISAFRLRP